MESVVRVTPVKRSIPAAENADAGEEAEEGMPAMPLRPVRPKDMPRAG